MQRRVDNGEARSDIEGVGRLAKFWEQEQQQQKSADDVHINVLLGILGQLKGIERDPSICKNSVHTGQRARHTCGELLDRIVAIHVQFPHFNRTLVSACGFQDLLFRGFAFDCAADGHDEFFGAEATQMKTCFVSKAGIRARYDDSLAMEVGLRVGEGYEEIGQDSAE